jgi:hypothetical protein
LLRAAERAGFEVLVTPDKNIRYQQNLKNYAIAIVVLGSPQWCEVDIPACDTSSCGPSRRGCGKCSEARHLQR